MSVVILSGGLDSTVLLTKVRKDVKSILTFDYKQRHRKEIDSAKAIIEYFGLQNKYHIVDLSNINRLISKGALAGDTSVPHAMYNEATQKQTIVPNRNMIMLSIAVGHAVAIGAKKVYYAAHASDYEIYPDCRPEFVKAFDSAVYLANLWSPVEVEAPFVHMSKADIVDLGLRIGAPLNLTWSCYEGGNRPCLECGTCLERTEAFLKNNTRDPALTEDEWKLAIKTYLEMTTNE